MASKGGASLDSAGMARSGSSRSGNGPSQEHQQHHHHHLHHLPQPPAAPHASTAFGDWVNEVDSTAPILADRIYGDDVSEGSEQSDEDERQGANSDAAADGGDGSGKGQSNGDSPLDDHLSWAKDLSWWRRPHDYWLRPFAFLLAMCGGMVMSPKIDLYTQLACEDILHIDDGGMGSLGGIGQRPPLSPLCLESPQVIAEATALQLKLTLAMGILSALTTGLWGGLSDRKGRITVLRLGVAGLTLNDVIVLVVGLLPAASLAPFGGPKGLLIVGSAIEGVLGGFATLAAGHQAYIADVTPSGTRARIFAFFTGILFAGLAVGPALGGLLAKKSGLMSPFYVCLGAHVVYLIVTMFLLPESVSPQRLEKAREQHRRETEQQVYTIKSTLLVPLKPLAVLLPKRAGADPGYAGNSSSFPHNDDDEGEASASHISVSRKPRSWKAYDANLFILSLAYFVEASSMGVLTPKISYARYVLHWDVAELAYFLSFVSITRVICLTLIIPFIVRWAQKPGEATKNLVLPQDSGDSKGGSVEEDADTERSPLLSLDAEGRPHRKYTDNPTRTNSGSLPLGEREAYIERLWTLRARHLRQLHDSKFDKRLAICSVLWYGFMYTILTVTHGMGSVPFVAATGLTSLGGAAPAAMSSLALALLPSEHDAGKLFGAWSVLNAISTSIVGPIAFVEVFNHTDDGAPQTIFAMAVAFFVVAAIFTSLVQVRPRSSLPALPPRPPASSSEISTVRGMGSQRDREEVQDDGPEASSRSKIRLRPTVPWKKGQKTSSANDSS